MCVGGGCVCSSVAGRLRNAAVPVWRAGSVFGILAAHINLAVRASIHTNTTTQAALAECCVAAARLATS